MITLAPKNSAKDQTIEQWLASSVPPVEPLNKDNLAFLEALSSELMKNPTAKAIPELVALGFWLRQRNLRKMFKPLLHKTSGVVRKPLGSVIHFTPANVDTMFVYSWVCSLLCGNKNIVRVATAQSNTKDELLDTIDRLFQEPHFESVAKRNWFVSYDKATNISQQLSQFADARIIWGGDDSVNSIRALPCKPRCRDISFADRYSATILDLRKVQDNRVATDIANRLWRDTLPYQQQACSSPRVIYYLGDKIFLNDVLTALDKLAKQQEIAITQKNNQLVNLQLTQSMEQDSEILLQNHICAIEVSRLTEATIEWHNGENVFYIRELRKPEDVFKDHLDKLQTLSYWGLNERDKLKLLCDPSISGIDRVVPAGQVLEFDPLWDGFDLTNQLSRVVTVK